MALTIISECSLRPFNVSIGNYYYYHVFLAFYEKILTIEKHHCINIKRASKPQEYINVRN